MSSVYFRFRAPSVYLLLLFSAIFLFSVLFSFTLSRKNDRNAIHSGFIVGFSSFGYISETSAAEQRLEGRSFQHSLRARWCVMCVTHWQRHRRFPFWFGVPQQNSYPAYTKKQQEGDAGATKPCRISLFLSFFLPLQCSHVERDTSSQASHAHHGQEIRLPPVLNCL